MAMTLRVKMRSFVKGFSQSTLSLSFNLGGMLAGTLLASHLDVFSVTSWALLIFPGILSIRGAIGGVFSGRLGTALHTGRVRASFTKNTRYFHLLLNTIVVLTLKSSVVLGLAASLFSVSFLGTTLTDCYAIIGVTVTTMGLSLVFISPLTLGISVLAFKRGLDPDVIVYPMISTVADILVTTCYISVLRLYFALKWERYLIWLFNLIFFLIGCYIVIKNHKENVFVKTLKEFFFTLILLVFIVNVTGSILSEIVRIIGFKPEMYVVYPALIDTVGDVGSIVGSTATTKLALGLIGSTFSSIKQHLGEIVIAWSASLIMFTLYAIIASSIYGLAASKDILRFVARLLTTNILAVSFMVVVSFGVAIFTYRRGWDPDNFVIPIESSLADGITTISLLMVLTLTA